MVYPDRQRQKEKPKYHKNRSPSNQQEKYRRLSRSRSDSRDKKRPRDYRQPKQKPYYSHYNKPSNEHYDRFQRSNSKKKGQQSSQSDSGYQEREQQELQQKIRLAIRNNQLSYNKKLQQALMHLSQRRQQQLAQQARSPQKIHQMIMVRQLFISGINDINQYTITELMGKYGEIQNIQIIKDFAFVKYFRVQDASYACSDYHNINVSVQPLINSNFKIFFSDHLKRWNVVSNHPDYQITQYLVPVLYVSLKNDPHYANQKYLQKIFSKYGFIRNLQLRKNEFPGPKIHVNVEYETLQMAMRARQRLKNKRQKYFGQKKAQMAILIDSQKLIRAFPNTSNQIRYQKKRIQGNNPNIMSSGNSYTNLNSLNLYQDPMNPLPNTMGNPMGNQPPLSNNSYQTQDIFAMLDKLNQKKQESQMQMEPQQDADWAGFFTRNNQFKVQVQFNRLTKEAPANLQIILNVSHRGDIHEAINRTDYAFAGKFRAVNKLNQDAFNQYIKYFIKKNRGGIIFANEYLIYLLPPKDDINLPYKIRSNQMLGLFFKIKN